MRMKREDENSGEDDRLWEILKSASRQEPRGCFVDDALRLARQEESEVARPWVSFLRPLSAGFFALALVGSWWLLLRESGQKDPQMADVSADAALVSLEEDLSQELLLTAAENPSLFSDAEVLAMLD